MSRSLAGGLAVLLLCLGPAHAEGRVEAVLCQVKPNERVEVASPVAGVIEQVFVDRGDRVKRGQPLFALRADVEKADLALARARAASEAQLKSKRASLEFLERKLARNLDMRRQNLISENELDQLKTERANAAFDLEAAEDSHRLAKLEEAKAEALLALRTVRSPIDGFVVQRDLPAGNLVAEKPVMVVVATDPLHVVAALPSALYGSLHVGDAFTVAFDLPGVAAKRVSVRQIDEIIDAPSNTFAVRLVLPNPQNAIPAGAKCRLAQP